MAEVLINAGLLDAFDFNGLRAIAPGISEPDLDAFALGLDLYLTNKVFSFDGLVFELRSAIFDFSRVDIPELSVRWFLPPIVCARCVCVCCCVLLLRVMRGLH